MNLDNKLISFGNRNTLNKNSSVESNLNISSFENLNQQIPHIFDDGNCSIAFKAEEINTRWPSLIDLNSINTDEENWLMETGEEHNDSNIHFTFDSIDVCDFIHDNNNLLVTLRDLYLSDDSDYINVKTNNFFQNITPEIMVLNGELASKVAFNFYPSKPQLSSFELNTNGNTDDVIVVNTKHNLKEQFKVSRSIQSPRVGVSTTSRFPLKCSNNKPLIKLHNTISEATESSTVKPRSLNIQQRNMINGQCSISKRSLLKSSLPTKLTNWNNNAIVNRPLKSDSVPLISPVIDGSNNPLARTFDSRELVLLKSVTNTKNMNDNDSSSIGSSADSLNNNHSGVPCAPITLTKCIQSPIIRGIRPPSRVQSRTILSLNR